MSKRAKYRPSVKPKRINGQVAIRTDYYREELWKIIKGRFNLVAPMGWDTEYVLNLLVKDGYFVITDTDAGVLPLRASLSGINYTDAPSKAIISVPILGSMERTIGVDCVVVYLERQFGTKYYNFKRKVRIYSEQFASADCSIDVNLINSRLGYIAEAETKAQAETIKETYDRVTEGEPLVVPRSGTLEGTGLQLLFGNVKQQYVADVIQDTKRTIMNEFLTSIGINNANTDKKERLIVDEANSNNIELVANTSLWESNIKKSNKQVKEMFPNLKYKLELNFKVQTGGVDDFTRSREIMGVEKS